MATESDLIQALEAGDENGAVAYVTAQPDLAQARSAEGVSAPVYALYRGLERAAGAIAGAKGELDVFEAAALGRSDRARELLDADPELVRAWTPDGFTALHYAAFFDGPEVARLLIDRGADVSAVSKNPHLVVAPLHSASASRQLETVRALLDAGADPNATQPGGFTPLHAAAQHGDLEMAELLIERGADRAAATDEGKTAEDFAREAGHESVAARLTAGA